MITRHHQEVVGLMIKHLWR